MKYYSIWPEWISALFLVALLGKGCFNTPNWNLYQQAIFAGIPFIVGERGIAWDFALGVCCNSLGYLAKEVLIGFDGVKSFEIASWHSFVLGKL